MSNKQDININYNFLPGVIGGLGSMIAVTISWSLNKSILWCILHGIFSWFYVIYYAIFF